MDNSTEQPKKKRGRPPGTGKKRSTPPTPRPSLQGSQEDTDELKGATKHPEVSMRVNVNRNTSHLDMPEGGREPNEEELTHTLEVEKLSPFSSFLRTILPGNRSEITRLARELDVSENTIYRWMNGRTEEPRPTLLKELLE